MHYMRATNVHIRIHVDAFLLLSVKHTGYNVQDSKQSSYLHFSLEWYYLVANSRDMFSRDICLAYLS